MLNEEELWDDKEQEVKWRAKKVIMKFAPSFRS